MRPAVPTPPFRSIASAMHWLSVTHGLLTQQRVVGDGERGDPVIEMRRAHSGCSERGDDTPPLPLLVAYIDEH